MACSERLRSLSDWEAATRHPFIRRILDGTLARSALADSLIQD